MGSTRVRIAIDAMGGDHAPGEIVAGALRAKEELGVESIVGGDPQQIEAALPPKTNLAQVEIVPAQEAIAMDEEPLTAVRRKRKASINVAMDLVKQQKADAVFSAESLGAAMASALLRLGRLPGIDRPAIGTVFPTIVAGKPVLYLMSAQM